MFSNKRNILQLVALLREYGVRDIVACPGSRNAPIVHSLTQGTDYQLHAVTDERSAGFFALGLALKTGHPVAVCVTSGSAALNVHPAVAEAYYQGVPLVVISADRPQAWIGQMDGQTMPQEGVFGKMVRRSVSLPEVRTDEDEWYANRLICEALLELDHHGRGPVHINVPIGEPLYDFSVEELPRARVIRRVASLEELGGYEGYKRRMLIIGQISPHERIDEDMLRSLGKDWVIMAENLSQTTHLDCVVRDVDDVVASITKVEARSFRADLVVTYGGHLVSKKLKEFFRRVKPKAHWHICPDGQVADVFQALTAVVEAPLSCLVSDPRPWYLRKSSITVAGVWGRAWRTRALTVYKLARDRRCGLEEMALKTLIENLPSPCVLCLGNSSTVRMSQHYPVKGSTSVVCNRGMNGIEGSVSSAVGYAVACPEKKIFVVMGDLSFFYDQNGLWNTRLPRNLHILLLNSGGGRIFSTLPVPDDEETRRLVMAPHDTTAEGICRQSSVAYITAATEQELPEAISKLIKARGTMLLEVNVFRKP